MVATELTTSDATDRVDEVVAVEVFEPVLIRVMGIGTAVELVRRRIFAALLVTSILRTGQPIYNITLGETYAISFLVEHEGSNGPPGIGAVPGLTADTNSGAAPAVLVLSTRDGASGHRHVRVSGGSGKAGDNQSG